MKDFFISYNGKDKEWARWIASVLEERGYTTFIQAWDIRPGHNFVDKMDEGSKGCESTISVMSQNYIDAGFTHPEWQAAFRGDPRSQKRKLIPVRIDDFDISGLLGSIVYIDLVGCEEEDAKKELLNGVSDDGPVREAPFPGRIEPGKAETKIDTFPGGSINLAFNKLRLGDTQELVGREEAMEWLEKLLLENSDNNSTVALASLQGMGGMGKTFLAQAFVEKHCKDHTFIPVYLGDKKPFDAGIELLTRLGIPVDEIGNSSDYLACRPYAIRLAAGCMLNDEFDPSPETFLKNLHECELLKGEGATSMDDLGSLIEHCLLQLKEKSVKAFTYLCYLAVCGEEGISDSHFISWQAEREQVRKSGIKEALLCAHSLGILLIEKTDVTRLRLHTDTLNILKKEIPDDTPGSLMEYLKRKVVDRDEDEKLDRELQIQIYSLLNAYRKRSDIVSKLYEKFWKHLYSTGMLQFAYELGGAGLDVMNPEEIRDGYQTIIGYQALILQSWGRLEEALEVYKKQERIFEKLGNQEGLAKSYGNQGLILYSWGQLKEAMELHKKQEKICETLGNQEGLAISYGNQALILKKWGQMEGAIELHKKEEEICGTLGNPESLLICRWNLGVLFRALNGHDEAIAMFESVVDLEEKFKFPRLEESKKYLEEYRKSLGK